MTPHIPSRSNLLLFCLDTNGIVRHMNVAAQQIFRGPSSLPTALRNVVPADFGLELMQACRELTVERPERWLAYTPAAANNIMINWSISAAFNPQGAAHEFYAMGIVRPAHSSLNVVAEIASHLSRLATRTEMLEVITEHVAALFEALNVTFVSLVAETESLELQSVFGSGSDHAGRSVSEPFPIFAEILEGGQPSNGERVLNSLNQMLNGALENCTHALAVPLTSGAYPIGVLCVARQGEFLPDDIIQLRVIADIATNAIYRADLIEWLGHSIAQRVTDLEGANVRLAELDSMKARFIKNISHELRTPVSVFNMSLYLLERAAPEKRDMYLGSLKTQLTNLNTLIENVLNFSRLQEEIISRPLEAVDLNEAVTKIFDESLYQAEMAEIDMTFDPDESKPLILGDYEQIQQLSRNLINNALNFTEEGQVEITTHIDRDLNCAVLTIADTGVGIPQDDIKHVFDQFYRAQNVSELSRPGMGLGLSVVKEIVDRHGGAIRLESEINSGTTIRVYLPLFVG